MKKLTRREKIMLIPIALFLFALYDATFNYVDWATARRSSAGLAPKPEEEKEAVVQVYAARTYNWRGYFAVHPWIAIKPKNADRYTVYQVTGWNLWRQGTSVSARPDVPDRYWYGRRPQLLQTLTGESAEKAIPQIEQAAADYPYADRYQLWPGPNSNTFIAYILRRVPELTVELPPHAIGKDFLGYTGFFAPSETGSGFQISFWGVLGLTVGWKDGIELNILSLNFGIDFYPPALKLPLIGRVGFADR